MYDVSSVVLFFHRTVYGTFDGKQKLHGVTLNRYSAPEEEFENVTLNPNNIGYCVPDGECWDAGVLNNEECFKGSSCNA